MPRHKGHVFSKAARIAERINDERLGTRRRASTRDSSALNVTGGFLVIFVKRENGTPMLIFRHYSVDGEILNEDVLAGER